MSYKILVHEVTGVNGISYHKGQIVNEEKLNANSITDLLEIKAIELVEEKKVKTKPTE